MLNELRSKLEEIKKDPLLDQKYEFTVMPKDDLSQILKSKMSIKKKKSLLLTQIGYVRINLFSEYYEQIQQAQRNNELDVAVKLMNKYADIAIPFISTKKKPALVMWLKRLASTRGVTEPAAYITEWKTGFETWLKHTESARPKIIEMKRIEEYDHLKKTFFTLYTYSFSVANFPPLRNKRSDH